MKKLFIYLAIAASSVLASSCYFDAYGFSYDPFPPTDVIVVREAPIVRNRVIVRENRRIQQRNVPMGPMRQPTPRRGMRR